jgi:hypothetical protein
MSSKRGLRKFSRQPLVQRSSDEEDVHWEDLKLENWESSGFELRQDKNGGFGFRDRVGRFLSLGVSLVLLAVAVTVVSGVTVWAVMNSIQSSGFTVRH